MSAGIDWFIPAHVRGGDLDVLRRTRLVVTFTLTLILLAILYLMTFTWMGSEFCAYALGGAISIALFVLYLMRRGTSALLTGNLLAAASFGVFTVIACRLGGHGALTLPWYASVPVIAAIITGRRSAIVWVVIATLFLVAFYALDYSGYVFPNDLAAHHYKLLHLLATTGLILLILAFAHLYESAQDQMLRQVRKAELELRKNEEKYRLLADNTLDCIWQTDTALRFTYVNPAIFPMLGFTPEEWVGSRLADHCSPEEAAELSTLIAELLETKDTYSTMFEMRLDHKDGAKIYCEITGHILVDGNGNPVQFQGTTRDITERKRAEVALQAAKEQADDHVRRATEAMADMKRMNAVMVGREERVLDMKQEVNDLLAELGQERKYEHV